MKKIFITLTLFVILIASFAPLGSASALDIPTVTGLQLDVDDLEFGLTEDEDLWLRSGNALYYSINSGDSWSNISPKTDMVEPHMIVSFSGRNLGHALYLTQTETMLNLEIYRTTTKGKSWSGVEGNLEESIKKQFSHPVGAIQMQWLNEKQAFVLVKAATSSNFSHGFLFVSGDGGNNWQTQALPAAEEFVFLNAQVGFMRNPANATTLYLSSDGGGSWSLFEVSVPEVSTWEVASLDLPIVTNDGQVYLPLKMTENGENELDILANLFQYDQPTAKVEFELSDLKVIQPEESGNQVLDKDRLYVGEIQTQNGLDFWISLTSGECENLFIDDSSQQISCQSTWRIMRSSHDEFGWVTVKLPGGGEFASKNFTSQSGISQENLDSALIENTWIEVYKGHAFDKCEIPTLAQLNTWYSKSPYKAVNVYMGGISRACANTPFSASYLKQIHQQGWRFILTWVGHQSSCSGLNYPFPNDVNQAYQYGVDNANLAKARLQQFNLSNPNGSGAIVYLDLENFTFTSACSAAARAYVNGWTTRLSQLGIRSGLYTSSRGVRDNKYYNISKVPSAVWLAEWYATPGFRPDETVWNLRYLPNELWAYNQRIVQYSGPHTGTWGGVSMNIDSNVAEGLVSVPYGAIVFYNNRIWLPILRKNR